MLHADPVGRTLEGRSRGYDAVGATSPSEPVWTGSTEGYRRLEDVVRVGAGPACWAAATASLLRWGVKTRSGFAVRPAADEVRAGDRRWLVARVGPVRVREPVVVVEVVETPDCVGFSYGTLRGHPVAGEECFVLRRSAAGEVTLTLRSLTRPGRGVWRPLFPVLLLAQRWYRRRYRRALQDLTGG